MLLSEALGWFYLSMDSVKSPATITFYKRRLPSLIEHLGDVEIDSITIDHLRLWRKAIADQPKRYVNHPSRKPVEGRRSVHTLDQYVRCARRFFRWLYTEGRIDRNPSERLERPPLPSQRRRGIPKSDVMKLLKIAKAENRVRDYAIIILLADTACRVGGVAGLMLTDLFLDRRRAIVHEKGRGGNNKERPIFLQPRTVEALRAYLATRPACDDPHLFIAHGHPRHPGYHGLTENGIYEAIADLAAKAGIEKGFNPHNFRHGAIRGWLNKGMPLSKASQLAGHSSTKVTGDIYGTSNDDELEDAHDRYGWMD